MPANPLQPFLTSWQKRLSQAQQAGVDPEAFRPVFSMDLQRLQQGSAPLTDQQAAVAIGGAAGAQPIKQTGSAKPDWNPMHLLGGIGKDVGSTLKMLPRIPGAVAKDLSHIGEMPGAIAKGAGEIATGKVGEGLQDIAKAPGLQSLLLAADFIPGVDAVTLPITAGVLAGGELGKALTPAGRKEISQHPGNTLLNLLPGAKELDLIGGVSKVANLSDAEKARVLTGNMTEEELATKTMVRVPGKVRAALQQTPAYQQAAEKMAGKGFGTDMRALFVAHNEAIKELGHSMDAFANQHGVMDWAALDEGTRQSITHELGFARKGGDSLASSLSKAGVPSSEIPRLSQSLAPMVDFIAQRGEELMSKGDYMHVPIPAEYGGGFEIYHPSDAVAKRYATLDAASQTHVNALDRLQAATDRLEAAGAAPDLTRITSEVQKLAKQDLASNGASGAIVQAEQDLAAGRLGKASQGLRKAGVNLYADQLDSLRNGKSFKARDELAKAQTTAEKAKGTYRKAQSDFHRSLAKHPSPRYMPAVEDAYWKKMTQIAQGLHTDNPALNEVAIQAAGDKFKSATFEDGTKVFPQADKVLNQTAKEWLTMRQNGLDPVFLHKMAGEFQAGALPKIDPGAILKPSTLKARSLDVSGGYYDLGFGLVRSQAEFESERLARQVVEEHIIPHLTKPKDEVVANLLERARKSGDASATQAGVESQLMQDHVAFNAQPFGTKRIKGTTDRIISKDIQGQIDRLAGESPNQNFLMRGLRKGTGVYIFAVTGLSPLHQAHVLMSNLFASMSTDPVRAVQSVTDGWNLMKGRGEFAGEVPYTLRNPAQLPEELANLNGAGGKTAIRLAVESKMPLAEKGLNATEQAKHYALWFPKKLQEYQVRMDEYMSTMARSVNYVMQRKEGWDPEQALREVGRVYALHTDLSPFERNVMRSFAPFYSWCLDRDSECLTKRGWVAGADLKDDDTILSARPDGSLAWSSIKSIYRERHVGPMVRMENRQMDALCTPHHKWLLTSGELKETWRLRQNDVLRLMGQGVDGPEVYSDAFVELVGWAVTEGHYKRARGTTIEIAQKDGTPTCDQIRWTLKRAGARWHEFKAGVERKIRYFGVTGEVSREIRRVAPGRVMSEEFLLALSLSQRRVLLDTMIAADGSIAARGKGDRPTFCQKDEAAVDAFCMLATMAGVTTYKRRNGAVWHVTLRNTTTARVQNMKRTTEWYDGMIWCPETEHGTFVARRNGKVYITGNTRYLMRFALQYPFDHPVRAGIVSNFAQTETEDWGKGLPQDYAQLFFLGHPDPNTGKQSAFDIRQINPFRDVGRDFTWAGVVGSLHPVIGAALTSMGMNTYSGSAELYPELTVDPNTGQLKAKGTSFLGNLAHEAVPQTKAIEGLLGWSDQMRQLQKTDPSGFRASIARSFHFPWLPKDISIPQARAKEQLNQLRVAQQDISNALKTGKFGPANQFNKVPFQGHLVPPQTLQALYQLLQSKNTGFTPNTLLRK